MALQPPQAIQTWLVLLGEMQTVYLIICMKYPCVNYVHYFLEMAN